MTEAEEYITFAQAATVARVEASNLRKWIQRGKLKADKPDGLHWRIAVSDLMETLTLYPPKKGGRGKPKPGAGKPKPGAGKEAQAAGTGIRKGKV